MVEKKHDEAYCRSCGAIIKKEAEICVKCGVRQIPAQGHKKKSRVTAIILALFLGGFGVHKFYMGKMIGLLYLFFCWTFIPLIISLIEAIIYITETDEEFNRKHVNN